MRLFLFLAAGLLSTATPARAADTPPAAENPHDALAGVPAPLAAAIRGFAQDANRWAYTQRFEQFDRKGVSKEVWIARHDPSQPPDEQWTLLERDGKKPAGRQQEKFRRARLELERKGRKSLGEQLELKQAAPAADQPDSAGFLTYEVPLLRSDDMPLPPEKFQVFVRITRGTHRLRAIDVQLRSKLRMAGVVSVKAGELRLRFADVRADCGPAASFMTASASASVLLIPVGGRSEATRSDFKRVTPYNERLKVKLGPLKVLDF